MWLEPGAENVDCSHREFSNEHIEDKAFSIDNNRLKVLRLNNNKLSVLKDIWFKTLIGLLELYAQNNLIAAVGENVFRSNRNIELIDLDDNAIAEFHVRVSGLKQLGRLGLRNNALVSLTEAVFRAASASPGRSRKVALTVDVGGNPLGCGCDMMWLMLPPGSSNDTPSAESPGGYGVSFTFGDDVCTGEPLVGVRIQCLTDADVQYCDQYQANVTDWHYKCRG